MSDVPLEKISVLWDIVEKMAKIMFAFSFAIVGLAASIFMFRPSGVLAVITLGWAAVLLTHMAVVAIRLARIVADRLS